MTTRESKIERDFCQAAKLRGWKVVKFTTPTENGWPDRLCVKNGVHVYIEFKRVGEEPKPHQYKKIAEVKRLGCNAEWFDNAEAALAYLKECYDKR